MCRRFSSKRRFIFVIIFRWIVKIVTDFDDFLISWKIQRQKRNCLLLPNINRRIGGELLKFNMSLCIFISIFVMRSVLWLNLLVITKMNGQTTNFIFVKRLLGNYSRSSGIYFAYECYKRVRYLVFIFTAMLINYFLEISRFCVLLIVEFIEQSCEECTNCWNACLWWRILVMKVHIFAQYCPFAY